MEKKKKNIDKKIIIFLVCIGIGIVGFLISFVMYLKKDTKVIKKNTQNNPVTKTNNQPVEIVTGDIVFQSIDESVYLDNAVPTLDKFGSLGKPFNFTIKNNGKESKNFILKLVDDNSTIPNKFIRYELSKNDKVLGIYTLDDTGNLDISQIKSLEEIKYSIKIWLDYNSDVKIGTFSKKISVLLENIEIENDNVNKPVLTSGMIPVYYDNESNSWLKCDNKNTYSYEWYNYDEHKWANAVTVNSEKRKDYLNSPIGTKIEIEDINAFWVWIPRFNYIGDANNINITFVDSMTKAYPAFTFNNKELEGFWISKFESGIKEDSACFKSSLPSDCNKVSNKLYFVPNYSFNNRITMANMFYAIRSMELKNNIYGFKNNGTKLNNDGTIKKDSNNIDTHLVKNIEWQAVALLSSSKYGVLDNKISNNASDYTGNALVNGQNYDYNVQNMGVKASTTGNVYGIYDMAGGKREFVMLNNKEINLFNKKSNSGFTSKIKEYYYDNDFSDSDTSKIYQEKFSKENLINNEPITRGGYKNTGNIFNIYCAQDYINKISLETNARASLVIIKEK